MKHEKIRIFLNAIAAIFIALSKIIIHKRRKVTYFNANTGFAEYKTTYYFLLFIPVFWRTERTPITRHK